MTRRTRAAVPRNAFLFCRITMAALLWSAFFLRQAWIVALVTALLALSALLTVRHAPLIALYRATIGRFVRSRDEELDVRGMRIAHALGTTLGLISLALLSRSDPRAGWRFVLFFCLLKTISAAGFCPAYKLYSCLTNGSCCAFLRKAK
jgi:hypothetical protein